MEFKNKDYIIYVNGDSYELGRIKSITEDGAFVAYHEGETGAKTPFDKMHKLVNSYCIKETSLGGVYFSNNKEEIPHWIYWRESGIKRCKCSSCLTSYGCMDTPYCPNCGVRVYGEVEWLNDDK